MRGDKLENSQDLKTTYHFSPFTFHLFRRFPFNLNYAQASFNQNGSFHKTKVTQMKKCPNCNQVFSADEAFCVECGTPLLTHFDSGQSSSGFSVSLEQPTQMVSRPYQPAPFPPSSVALTKADNSKWLYVVIGIMTAIIVGMGGYFLISRAPNEKETAVSVNQTEEKPISENNSPSNKKSTKTPMPTATSMPTANKTIKLSNTPPLNSNTVKTQFPLTRNFNRTYSGTIDNDGITMQLQRSGSTLSGKVFSRRSATDISVSGSIYDDGSFELGEFSDIGVMTGNYSGQINPDGTMTGTWTKPDGSKPRPLSLRTN